MFKIKCLPKTVLRLIYNAIILPYLYYGITAWGNACQSHIQRIIILQKRAIRIVAHAPFLAHSQPLFSTLKILHFTDMYKFQVAIFMFLCQHRLLPKSLLQLFFLNNHFHNYSTRSASDFHIPKSHTTFFQRTIIYTGPHLWNSLPCAIRDSKSLNIFKSRYKKYLLNAV